MREKLKNYVNLLFAGSTGTEDMQQEILQNTLDRYDDLVSQGKTEEEAYRLAVSGIGDIDELLGRSDRPYEEAAGAYSPLGKRICDGVAVAIYILSPIPLFLFQNVVGLCCLLGMVACGVVIQVLARKLMDSLEQSDPIAKGTRTALHAIAIALYILCPVPLFLFGDEIGLCCLLGFVAIGVAMQIVAGGTRPMEKVTAKKDPVRKNISSLIWLLGTALYFIYSFATGAWWISWIIFPITGAISSLIFSILDLINGASPGRKIAKLIVQAILILILAGILLGGLTYSKLSKLVTVGNYSGPASSPQDILAENGAFHAADIQQLNIDWAIGSVNVVQNTGDEILYSVTGDTEAATVCRQDGKLLTISYQTGKSFWAGILQGKELTVSIPKSWNGEKVDITSVSAGIQVDSLHAEELDLESVSGSIDTNGIKATKVSVDTVSGAVTFSGAAQVLELDSTSGSCSVDLTENAEQISIDSISGSLNLFLPPKSGFTLKLDTVSGKFRTDFNYTCPPGSTYASGDGSCTIRADTVSGDINIRQK